jgi:AraC family transcriptional regulator
MVPVGNLTTFQQRTTLEPDMCLEGEPMVLGLKADHDPVSPARAITNATDVSCRSRAQTKNSAHYNDCAFSKTVNSRIEVAPRNIASRIERNGDGMAAEIVQLTERERVDFRFQAPVNLFVVVEDGVRVEGETSIEGLPRSAARDLRRKLSFVPAGHGFHEWQQPSVLARVIYFYFDAEKLEFEHESERSALRRPRLFFEDAALWETTLKLKRLIDFPGADSGICFDALGIILAYELARPELASSQTALTRRGGLAGWQQRLLSDYLEENLAERVELAELAKLVRLSRHHLCRAFKQSFGVPPHRYHIGRRMERAKALLAKPGCSVTEIGLALGFSDTSTFSTAFRKETGLTPTAYHRSLA